MGIHLLCCWPGLAALWYRGIQRGLLLAVLFSWIVCLLLLATFVWPMWFHVWVIRLAWILVGVAWILGTVQSHWTLGRLIGNPDRKSQSAFVQAQAEYLKGNWFEAEAILLDLLQDFPRDAEALLLLVGVLRHTKRWQPAIRRLDQLELLDTSIPWRFEILRERRIIEACMAQSLQTEIVEPQQ